MIEHIVYEGNLLAIIIRQNFDKPGVHFFTEGGLSQQLAYMHHSKGNIIAPHVHNPVKREVHYTQEVLLIKRGKLRVDFYTENKFYLKSRLLEAGDVILLASGGHGFEAIEELEMIEVKQGPYTGDLDKTHFVGIDPDKVCFLEKKND
jgi:mannose-6-phosphate isomerase-like protein (cupin superfamily)